MSEDVKTEINNIIDAIDDFSIAMKKEMVNKVFEGYEGWNDTSNSDTKQYFKDRLQECVAGKKYIHAANFSMMLYNFQKHGK